MSAELGLPWPALYVLSLLPLYLVPASPWYLDAHIERISNSTTVLSPERRMPTTSSGCAATLNAAVLHRQTPGSNPGPGVPPYPWKAHVHACRSSLLRRRRAPRHVPPPPLCSPWPGRHRKAPAVPSLSTGTLGALRKGLDIGAKSEDGVW